MAIQLSLIVYQRFLKSYVSTTLEILCSERQKSNNLVMKTAICWMTRTR